MTNTQLDCEAAIFAHDLGRVGELLPCTAVAMLRGEGHAELVEWFRIRHNLGTHLYAEIIGPHHQMMRLIKEILSAKNLPVDWLS